MKRLLLLLKGMAMGGADLIPGVSGGTIALITGIYAELISSIKSIDSGLVKLLFALEFKQIWTKVNGPFLVTVFSGVLISVFSLAKLITYLLEVHPIPLWSFFFGLILISAFYVIPGERNLKSWLALLVGAVLAYGITSLSQAETPNEYWFVFLSGSIAICAMILPGISGSFILLILGKYEYVLNAVKSLDIITILVFGLGCLVGIISFAKLIDWLLKKHQNVTLSVLAGFMLGSLNKIWPWKLDIGGGEYMQETSIGFKNVLPDTFSRVSGEPSLWLIGLFACLLAVAIVFVLEKLGNRVES